MKANFCNGVEEESFEQYIWIWHIRNEIQPKGTGVFRVFLTFRNAKFASPFPPIVRVHIFLVCNEKFKFCSVLNFGANAASTISSLNWKVAICSPHKFKRSQVFIYSRHSTFHWWPLSIPSPSSSLDLFIFKCLYFCKAGSPPPSMLIPSVLVPYLLTQWYCGIFPDSTALWLSKRITEMQEESCWWRRRIFLIKSSAVHNCCNKW